MIVRLDLYPHAPNFLVVSERLDTYYHALQRHIPRIDDQGKQPHGDSGFVRKQTEGLYDGRRRENPDCGSGCESCRDYGRGRVAEGAEVPRLCGLVPAQMAVNQRIDAMRRTLTWCTLVLPSCLCVAVGLPKKEPLRVRVRC